MTLHVKIIRSKIIAYCCPVYLTKIFKGTSQFKYSIISLNNYKKILKNHGYNWILPLLFRINFPLEIKSLPRESMLIIKVFGIDSATHSANLLAWTCLPLFPKE